MSDRQMRNYWTGLLNLFRRSRGRTQRQELRSRRLRVEGLEARDLMASIALDPTFDHDGKVTVSFGSGAAASAMVVQPDGKILVGGYVSFSGNLDFAVFRFNPDGSRDLPFGGGDGVATMGGFTSTSDDTVNGLALQPDGKIVAVGGTDFADFLVARFNADGSADNGFGTSGRVKTNLGSLYDEAYSAAIQADGKIIVAGKYYNGSDDDFAMVRYNANGTPDKFGTQSKIVWNVTPGDYDEVVAVTAIKSGPLPVGDILLGGYTDIGNGTYKITIGLFKPDGTPDPAAVFGGTNGVRTKTLPNIETGSFGVRGFLVNDDGTVIVTGYDTVGSEDAFAAIKLDASGNRDAAFNGGAVLKSVVVSGNEQAAYAAAFQPDGKLLLAGFSHNQLAVERFGNSPTITTFSVPTRAAVERSVTLTAAAYAGTESNPVDTYRWYVTSPAGFIQTSKTQDLTFTPPAIGTYTAKLIVRDALNIPAVRTQKIQVIAKTPQIHRFVVPATAAEASTIVLTATAFEAASTTPVSSYHWDLTGPFYSTSFDTQRVVLKMPDDGPFTATLTVTDQFGEKATRSATILGTNVAPVLQEMVVPTTAKILDTVKFSARATDVAGTRDTISFKWLITGPFGYRKTLTGAAPSWTNHFVQGTYTVALTVSDEDGGSAVLSKTIHLS